MQKQILIGVVALVLGAGTAFAQGGGGGGGSGGGGSSGGGGTSSGGGSATGGAAGSGNAGGAVPTGPNIPGNPSRPSTAPRSDADTSNLPGGRTPGSMIGGSTRNAPIDQPGTAGSGIGAGDRGSGTTGADTSLSRAPSSGATQPNADPVVPPTQLECSRAPSSTSRWTQGELDRYCGR